MKKRSSKPRLPKQPTEVALECAEYRSQISAYVCEVEDFLKKDDDAKAWIRKQELANNWMATRTEIHHIWGRGRPSEHEWFCSLVQIFKSSHNYGHDVNPPALEICSLMAKLERHEKYLLLSEGGIIDREIAPNRLHVNQTAMAKVCGSPTIEGRIEGILLPKLRGTVFETYCDHVLKELPKYKS